jgi:E3 ubiquitin-protein ligase SHPRH
VHGIFTAFWAISELIFAMRRECQSVGSCGKLSSKLRALLSDLPWDQLSVIFASSKAISSSMYWIGCRGLFTGQTEQDSERAVSEWQSDDSVFVLVVHAGAAACGLTLTVACKMLLMEPFIKQEDEKQSYARVYRYDNGKQSSAKCIILQSL